LDKLVPEVLLLPSVTWLLMPKQKAVVTEKLAASNPNANSGPKRTQPPPDRKVNPKSGKFDKLKNKRGTKTPMPVQLRGGTRVDAEGRAICYGFNLGTCHEKGCKRGRHICCHPGCFSATHNFLNHDKAA
jgi:hypothetical protein